ncbi:hypothetical protein AKO1_009855 [Acrasis kona]|uniref:Uncharacterized protein n=1 Tax=Acrasis kona TaxID=1008807 RepID=A0AAW2ZNI5_9EUKA
MSTNAKARLTKILRITQKTLRLLKSLVTTNLVSTIFVCTTLLLITACIIQVKLNKQIAYDAASTISKAHDHWKFIDKKIKINKDVMAGAKPNRANKVAVVIACDTKRITDLLAVAHNWEQNKTPPCTEGTKQDIPLIIYTEEDNSQFQHSVKKSNMFSCFSEVIFHHHPTMNLALLIHNVDVHTKFDYLFRMSLELVPLVPNWLSILNQLTETTKPFYILGAINTESKNVRDPLMRLHMEEDAIFGTSLGYRLLLNNTNNASVKDQFKMMQKDFLNYGRQMWHYLVYHNFIARVPNDEAWFYIKKN